MLERPAASGGSSDGHVTISVDCAPPTSSPQQHREWLQDVALFEKQNPDITINSVFENPCEVRRRSPRCCGRQRAEHLLHVLHRQEPGPGRGPGRRHHALREQHDGAHPEGHRADRDGRGDADKTLYGLPTVNYTQGLIINRKLFQQASLNPDQPPTTWAEVAADAKAITKLGHGIYGYGDYSAGNNGGWHFSSEIDAEGGQMINSAGTGAAFNSDQGQAVLQALHQMRFVDKSMSPTQQLAWGTLQKQMAAGKLGMYIAAPDDIYNIIVPQDGGNITDYGMGPLPSTSGSPAGSLSGGNDYMFAKHDTPAQIRPASSGWCSRT